MQDASQPSSKEGCLVPLSMVLPRPERKVISSMVLLPSWGHQWLSQPKSSQHSRTTQGSDSPAPFLTMGTENLIGAAYFQLGHLSSRQGPESRPSPKGSLSPPVTSLPRPALQEKIAQVSGQHPSLLSAAGGCPIPGDLREDRGGECERGIFWKWPLKKRPRFLSLHPVRN